MVSPMARISSLVNCSEWLRMRARDSTRCAISAAPLMANYMQVMPAPATGTGSRVPSAEAWNSSVCLRSVVPLRWLWA